MTWQQIIIKHKKFIVILFMLMAIISSVAQFSVSVNYNMVDYLPEDAQSTRAMEIMEREFTASVPNTRVLVHDITVQEALALKEKIASIDGVTDVLWLDNVVDLKVPLEMADSKMVETYYKDGNALFSISVINGEEVPVTDAIYALIGEDDAIAGEAMDTATSQKMAGNESLYAAALLVPIIIFILVISTTSWVEPVLFLTAIGVSVLINLGTNIFIGEVSFVTQSVAPILQLAVSLDYAIFLLHSFSDYQKKTKHPEEAMQLAMKESFPAIAASAATTFFGFIALTFMEFELGADLGINLVKGILLSFLSVMIFLPALTLCFYKWLDKTKHKTFVPSFKGVGNFVLKFRFPSLLLVLLIIVPSYLAQSNTNFTYGIGDLPEDTRAGRDFVMIEEKFGQFTPIVLLVPNGDRAKEIELVQELEEINYVTSVISYVGTVGAVIPHEYLDESIRNEFLSENYSRIIVNTNAGKEGDIPFSIIENVQSVTANYYGDEALFLGESATLFDLKNTIELDNLVVNLLTVITIAFVLLFTFKSITYPVILLMTIQTSVWVNLSVPYFTDSPLVFVGYLIISTVQLAATVDYAILFTETYRELRKSMPALDAVKLTLDEKTFSISISASILSSVGFILGITSTNPIIASIGYLLGRGALLAFLMVMFVLPAMLLIFDKLIKKTTIKANFYEEK